MYEIHSVCVCVVCSPPYLFFILFIFCFFFVAAIRSVFPSLIAWRFAFARRRRHRHRNRVHCLKSLALPF